MAVNIGLMTLYGIITESLSADFRVRGIVVTTGCPVLYILHALYMIMIIIYNARFTKKFYPQNLIRQCLLVDPWA